MFKEKRDEFLFNWSWLGNIKEGRPNLGNTMDVSVYRLMQFTLRDVLIKHFDNEVADTIFFEAGKKAGEEFFKNLITAKINFNEFLSEFQQLLKDLKIGILRIEKSDLEHLKFTITVAEDLDCSGLPLFNEQVCTYDEGFIAGIFGSFTAKEFEVKEVDCWASGERVCRFEAKVKAA